MSDDCKELFYLLQKPHVQVICSILCDLCEINKSGCLKGLLFTHDAVAQKDYYPHLPEIPLEVDEDEETIKIVQLVKSNEPLVGI